MSRRPVSPSIGTALGATALALLVVVLTAAAATAGYVITSAARTTRAPHSAPPPAPTALRAATVTPTAAASSAPGPAAAPGEVTARLAAALHAAGLGPRVRAEIVDLAAGTVLLDRGARVPVPPASTAKLLTAAAVLTVLAPTDRLRTTVRAGASGAVVLVGSGDPTLTGAPRGKPGRYPDAARLSDLAAQLQRAGVRPTKIVVDDSRFSGPSVSPSWAAEDVPSEYGAAITAVMADGGRATPGAPVRSATPDIAAGHELAAALGRPGLPVVRGRATSGARELASVASASLSTLIEQMLHESDNVIAECLARQVAVAQRQPTTFLGAAAAIRAVLRAPLGLDIGAGLVDGSGLAARDRVSPAALVAALRAGARLPRLRDLLTALPVGGWSGTLAGRYRDATTRAAAGLVRAKTGTLTGVTALAGLVHVRSGRAFAFAIVADRAPSTAGAEHAVDVLVDRLAGCGC